VSASKVKGLRRHLRWHGQGGNRFGTPARRLKSPAQPWRPRRVAPRSRDDLVDFPPGPGPVRRHQGVRQKRPSSLSAPRRRDQSPHFAEAACGQTKKDTVHHDQSVCFHNRHPPFDSHREEHSVGPRSALSSRLPSGSGFGPAVPIFNSSIVATPLEPSLSSVGVVSRRRVQVRRQGRVPLRRPKTAWSFPRRRPIPIRPMWKLHRACPRLGQLSAGTGGRFSPSIPMATLTRERSPPPGHTRWRRLAPANRRTDRPPSG